MSHGHGVRSAAVQLPWGQWANPWPTWRDKTLWELFWFWLTHRRPTIPHEPLVLRPTFEPVQTGFRVTWLGHAAALIETPTLTVLCDPVFAARCGPGWGLGYRRFTPPPCAVADLPQIDICTISHDHYDHLCTASVAELVRLQPEIVWCVPHGVGALVRACGAEHVREFGWWDTQTVHGAHVTSVPAQHWSGRGLWRNYSLWCGWVVDCGPKFYHAGDTGYCPAFTEIGEHFGGVDVALIPIGAYEPRAFMRPQHIDTAEALRVHADVRAALSIGIHHGVFPLTAEGATTPRAALEALRGDAEFICLDVGGTYSSD